MSRHSRTAAVAAVIACLAGGATALADDAGSPAVQTVSEFLVVVAPDVEGQAVPRADLAVIFLGHAQRWGDGKLIRVVDQSLQSEVRREFSQRVLGQSSQAMHAYWRAAIARNRTPPPVRDSDEGVLEYVASTPGSIGYVTPAAPVGDYPVKQLRVTYESP